MAADNKGQENTPGPALAHRHSRCINTPKTKIRNGDVHTFNQQDNSEEGSEDDLPLTPKQTNNERELFPELRRAKSVMFESVQQRKIFRYPPPPELFVPVKRAAWDNSDASDGSDEEQERKMKQDKKQKTGSDNDNTVVEGRDDEGKEQWWWSGWEEVPEEPFSEPEARGGRPQVRRRSHWFTEDSSDED